jgi:hypothetical protein
MRPSTRHSTAKPYSRARVSGEVGRGTGFNAALSG